MPHRRRGFSQVKTRHVQKSVLASKLLTALIFGPKIHLLWGYQSHHYKLQALPP